MISVDLGQYFYNCVIQLHFGYCETISIKKIGIIKCASVPAYLWRFVMFSSINHHEKAN